jgi:ATP-dependent DNA helicase RecG
MKIKNQQIVLKRTTPKNMAADQTTRTEEVPIVIALREAFVNMLIHRDYFDNTQYRIKIFKDKIEMFNPGSAPTEVKDLLADGATVPRNPIIAKVFRLIGWAETAGSGMMKIFNAWKQLDYDDPIIKNNIAGYTFKMTFPLIVSSKKKGKAELATQSATQSTDPVNRLLYILQDAELSSGELRLALKIKHRPTFRANYLHPAIEAGYIEYTIPDKPNSRLQKYRITAKGKSFLKKSEAVNPT